MEALTIDSVRQNRSTLALGLFAVGYNVAHHNALFGATELGHGTRLADWVDILTPFVVVGPLLWFLAIQRPRSRVWVTAVFGAILYVEGHGIHLSANSISNSAAEDTTGAQTLGLIHLWDEVAGHYLWYIGLAVLLASCIVSASNEQLAIPFVGAVICGGISGITWATNALEGGTAVFSLLCAVAAGVTAIRDARAGLLVPAATASLVAIGVIAGYGLLHAGFPQPSSL